MTTIDYKTCSNIWSRQGLDAGHGRITVPASYGKGDYDNDNCAQVNSADCPTGYKQTNSHGGNPDKDYGARRTAGTAVSDSVLKTKQCWRGGNTNGRGTQAVHGISHGVTGGYWSKSNESGGKNNYSKMCFKDAGGWELTNPENGNKGSDGNNKSACCGFKSSVRGRIQEKYCDPSYCYMEGSEYDSVSKKCSEHLLEKCRSWSFIEDDIGFEDSRCGTPLSQLSEIYDKKINELTDTQRSEQNNISASISSRNYASIGKDLCKVRDFINKLSSNETKKKKSEKCISWCKNNSNECKSIIGNVCEIIYNRANKYPDNFPDDLKEYEDICACNWPKEFYENIVEYYKTTYKVSDAALSKDRKCLFRPCGSSNLKYVGDSRNTCPQTNFVSCIQNLDIDFRGSDIQGTVNVDAGQSQECGSIADSGAGNNSPSSGDDTGSSDNGGDETGGGDGTGGGGDDEGGFMVIIALVIFFVCIIGLLVVLLK